MSRGVHITRARPPAAAELSSIAHEAKAHWGYPARWLKAWQRQLTVEPEFIARHPVFVAMQGGRVLGFCAIRPWRGFAEMEHFWVRPSAMGRGVGRALFARAVMAARRAGLRRMRIVSDPHAEGFYARMGARRVGESRSRLEGRWRVLPVMYFTVAAKSADSSRKK